MDDFNIGCFGQHPDEPMESCRGCPNEDDCLKVTAARHAGPLKTGEGSSDVDTSAFQVTDSEPTATADVAEVEGNSVRSPDTGTFGIRKWFTDLRSIPNGESKIDLPDDLKEMLSEPIEQAISVEHGSRSSEHAAIAEKGRLFCTIRNVIQDYKKSNKKAKLPVEFTVLFIGKKIFGRSRQTLYVWKRVWEAYGDSLKNMTDLTINKLDILTNLDKDKRDEWLRERTAELIEMDEKALKGLGRKPVDRKAPQGEFINGYRMVPGKTGTFIRGLTERDKLRAFLGRLDQGPEQGEEQQQTVPLDEQRIAFPKDADQSTDPLPPTQEPLKKKSSGKSVNEEILKEALKLAGKEYRLIQKKYPGDALPGVEKILSYTVERILTAKGGLDRKKTTRRDMIANWRELGWWPPEESRPRDRHNFFKTLEERVAEGKKWDFPARK